jgi:hypothetical protein
MRMIGQRTLGSPLREICTMGSKRGDGYKRPRSLGEGTGSKESDYSEAPQRATASRLVPTHQADFQPGSYGYRPRRTAHAALVRVAEAIALGKTHVIDLDLKSYFGAPGQTWCFQRVQFPPRQGERAAPPGIEPWTHGGNDMS